MFKIIERRQPNPNGPGEQINFSLVATHDIKAGTHIPAFLGYEKRCGAVVPGGEFYALLMGSVEIASESSRVFMGTNGGR